MKKIFKKAVTLLPLAVVTLPALVSAQTAPTAPITSVSDAGALVTKIAGYMEWGLIILAAIFGIAAGYIYLTAGGDTEKVGKAKNLLIYTIIAVAIGLLAGGISAVVANFFGVSSTALPGTNTTFTPPTP